MTGSVSAVKHEQLLEGLLTAEEVETEQEEALLAGLAQRVFAEKREGIRRLQGDTTQVRQGAPREHMTYHVCIIL